MLPAHAHAHDWLAWALFALIPAVPIALALFDKGDPDNGVTHEEEARPDSSDEPDGMLAAA